MENLCDQSSNALACANRFFNKLAGVVREGMLPFFPAPSPPRATATAREMPCRR